MYQALYRKWRPQTFDDVVGQSHITRTLKKQVTTGHLSHAYLFTGTRGTGKTTCAKLLAKAVNCEHPVGGNPCGQCAACRGIDSGSILDVVELDAASNNGVDQVRALRDEAIYAPAAVRRRVYIIDEVHMLSVAAFNALLKILEEPPEHLMFILATTELHKVPATILSRCQRFSFKRIQPADIQNRLRYIAQAEGIDLTEDGAALLARLADGALRDALSLLDQCAVSGGRVDKDAVLDALGLAGNTKTAHIMNHIRRGETAQALTELGELYAAGKDVGAVLSELAGLTRDLLLRQTTGGSAPGLMAGGYDEATMQALSRGLSSQRLLHMLTLLQDTQAKLKTSANRRTDAELCIIQLCDRRLDGSVLSLSERLSRIEAAWANGQLSGGTSHPFEGASQVDEPEEEPTSEPVPSQEEAGAEPPFLPDSPIESVHDVEPSPPEQADVPPFPEEPPAWEELPFPEEPPLPKSPPVSQTVQHPVRPAQPPVRKEQRKKTNKPTGDPRFWQELAPTLQSAVGPIAFGFISKQMVSGRYADGVLTLFVSDEGTKKWFSGEDRRAKLEQAAAAKARRPVQVQLMVGKPEENGSKPQLSPPRERETARKPAHTESESAGQGSAPSQKDEPDPEPSATAADPMAELLAFAQGEGKDIVTVE
ncbi:MAG: DNA polymerase III subunit gamma/tau [Clostridiales bacterium]|nr:DNA polymerase III subunit gamma/tau [Clostridiales bacterium]